METIPVVQLRGIVHKNREWIGIDTLPNSSVNAIIRSLPNRTFSASNKTWLVPLAPDVYDTLRRQLQHKAVVDVAPLKAYLMARKQPKAVVEVAETKVSVVDNQPNQQLVKWKARTTAFAMNKISKR